MAKKGFRLRGLVTGFIWAGCPWNRLSRSNIYFDSFCSLWQSQCNGAVQYSQTKANNGKGGQGLYTLLSTLAAKGSKKWKTLEVNRIPDMKTVPSPNLNSGNSPFNLCFDGILKTPSFELTPPTPFLSVKTKEIVIRLCTVLIFFLLVVLNIWVIFRLFIYLSVMGRYNPPPTHQN